MRPPPGTKEAFDWLRTLAQNRYFWVGIGGLVVLGILAYLLVDGVIMPSYTRHGVAVRVPNVEGRSFKKAKQRVENRDLQVLRQVGRYNPRVEQGAVVDQNPPPNATVKPGRRVYLTVNAGDIPMVDLPDLNGISIREARNRISSLGLEVGTVNPDTIPAPYPNTVTRQDPEPGDSLQQGKTVDLWFSTGLGADSVRVPSVVGRTVEEARHRLLQRRLRAIVVDPRTSQDPESVAQSDTSTTRFVQRQGRAPNTSVRTGTEIRLFTSGDPTSVPSPDSVGQDTSGQ